MEISQERLRELVIKALIEVGAFDKRPTSQKVKVYMMCTEKWDDKYSEFMKDMEKYDFVDVFCVIPEYFSLGEYERKLNCFNSYKEIVPLSQIQDDLANSITVFPVISQSIISKTALLINDTDKIRWITSCINQGGRIVYMLDGIPKFSGKEPVSYKQQVLTYIKKNLEFGIEIYADYKFLVDDNKNDNLKSDNLQEKFPKTILPSKNSKKRVITASNVEMFAQNGKLILNPTDIVTDLAKDRAKFLNISIVG